MVSTSAKVILLNQYFSNKLSLVMLSLSISFSIGGAASMVRLCIVYECLPVAAI